MSDEAIFAKSLCSGCKYMKGMTRGIDDTPMLVKCGKTGKWVKYKFNCKRFKEEDK